jgi:hypothetical protein
VDSTLIRVYVNRIVPEPGAVACDAKAEFGDRTEKIIRTGFCYSNLYFASGATAVGSVVVLQKNKAGGGLPQPPP